MTNEEVIKRLEEIDPAEKIGNDTLTPKDWERIFRAAVEHAEILKKLELEERR